MQKLQPLEPRRPRPLRALRRTARARVAATTGSAAPLPGGCATLAPRAQRGEDRDGVDDEEDHPEIHPRHVEREVLPARLPALFVDDVPGDDQAEDRSRRRSRSARRKTTRAGTRPGPSAAGSRSPACTPICCRRSTTARALMTPSAATPTSSPRPMNPWISRLNVTMCRGHVVDDLLHATPRPSRSHERRLELAAALSGSTPGGARTSASSDPRGPGTPTPASPATSRSRASRAMHVLEDPDHLQAHAPCPSACREPRSVSASKLPSS